VSDYRRDLAYIHAAGFLDFAREATPSVIGMLRAAGIDSGLVVELGSGSGETAAELDQAGYDVLGIDQSRAMVELARSRAPRARFRVGSWHEAQIPSCAAVIALGEVLGYVGAAKGTKAEWRAFLRRVRDALPVGGLFVFDLAVPGRVPGGELERFRTGPDWAILTRARERGGEVERSIETFRRIAGGATYRRSVETHRLRLRPAGETAALLREAGFAVRVRRAYGARPFVPGHRVFIARKR
jgi:SAM-dependent methyltransferase